MKYERGNMSKDNKKVKILLSSARMQELLKFLRIGDRAIVTVQKNLGKGKYVIELHGIKLIAMYSGLLHHNEKLHAVVHSLLPHVILKLTSPTDAISEKCILLKNRIASVDDMISIQPFIADMMQNIFILIDRYKVFLPASQKKESLALIQEQLNKQVININHTFSTNIHDTDIIENISSPMESLKKCQQILYDRFNELTSSVFANRLDAFFELKQEFDDLILHLLLLQEINKPDIMKKGYRYYQIPVFFKNQFGTIEVFLTQSNTNHMYDADVWFHHVGVDYFKLRINTNIKKIRILKIHDIRNKIRIKKVIALSIERLRELNWMLQFDEYVFTRTNGQGLFLYKPVVFDIKMPQHFTLVA